LNIGELFYDITTTDVGHKATRDLPRFGWLHIAAIEKMGTRKIATPENGSRCSRKDWSTVHAST
jgi:phage-related protein